MDTRDLRQLSLGWQFSRIVATRFEIYSDATLFPSNSNRLASRCSMHLRDKHSSLSRHSWWLFAREIHFWAQTIAMTRVERINSFACAPSGVDIYISRLESLDWPMKTRGVRISSSNYQLNLKSQVRSTFYNLLRDLSKKRYCDSRRIWMRYLLFPAQRYSNLAKIIWERYMKEKRGKKAQKNKS